MTADAAIAALKTPTEIESSSRLGHLLRVAIALVLLAIPLRIVALGWMPRDDVRRHAAKAVSGKEWPEIVVLRPDAQLDEHPGWHAVLGLLDRAGVSTPRGLALSSIVLLGWLFLVGPLSAFKSAEAWLLPLLGVALFEPGFFSRLLSGRPMVFSMAALVFLFASWQRFRSAKFPAAAMGGLVALFALAIWIHHTWYLWLLPIAAFFLVGERLAGFRIAVAWAAGTLLGAAFSGHPVGHLWQALQHLLWSFGTAADARMLATEFQPGQGSAALLLAIAFFLLWRRGALARRPLADPAFVFAVLAYLLGLSISRFWTDWGLPAVLVWLAAEIEFQLREHPARSGERTAVALVAAAALFLTVTSNRGDRWSSLEGERHLRLDNPVHREWLPAPGGILYSNSLGLFYDTFFENPAAPFRYILGFEPGLMPPEDLAILRAIQQASASDESFLPWARKLRAEDRLVIARQGPERPAISGLDWFAPFAGVWIGRLSGAEPAGSHPR